MAVQVMPLKDLARLKDNSAVPDLVHHAKRTQPALVLTNIIRAIAELRDRRKR